MRTYKNTSTAIKHLRQGEDFTNQKFQDHWKNREVYTKALVHQPHYFWFVVSKNPDIEWDADFMAELFERMLGEDTRLRTFHNIGPYLPPSVTDSKEIALKAAHIGSGDFRWYFAPDLAWDEDIRKAYAPMLDIEATSLTPDSISQLRERTDLLVNLVTACPELYWSLPVDMRRLREVCASICAHKATFLYAYGGLHDDEEFVLEVLNRTHELQFFEAFNRASYRIRKSVKDQQNPIAYLETVVAAKKLDAELSQKQAAEPMWHKAKV